MYTVRYVSKIFTYRRIDKITYFSEEKSDMKLIVGRAKSGKTKLMIEKIKNSLSLGNKTVLIVPETLSFKYEKELADVAFDGNKTDVESFSKISRSVTAYSKASAKPHIGQSGKMMLMQKALLSEKKNLALYANSVMQPNTALEFLNIRRELSQSDISVEDMKNCIEDENKGVLALKMKDFGRVFESFDSDMQMYTDDDTLEFEAASVISEMKSFEGADVYIDGFADFGEAHYAIINAINKNCACLTVSLCADEKMSGEGYFAPAVSAKKRLEELCGRAEIKYVHSDKSDGEIEFLCENYTKSNPGKYSKKTENIFVSESINVYTETDRAARFIKRMTSEKGYRYKDITVCVGDEQKYTDIVRNVFSSYGIPCFISQRRSASATGCINALESAALAALSDLSYDNIFSYLKSGFSNLEKDEYDRLENFCLAAGIRREHWQSDKPWNFKTSFFKDADDEGNAYIDSLRRKAAQPILRLRERIGRNFAVSDGVCAVYDFIKESKMDITTAKKAEKARSEGKISLSNDFICSYNAVIDVLDEMVTVCGNERFGREKFLQILICGLEGKELSNVPACIDEVTVTGVSRTRESDCKILVALGTNTGSFLGFSGSEGLISDSERSYLNSRGITMLSTAKKKVYDNRFSIYKAICAPSEILYVSRPMGDVSGKSMPRSSAIARIEKIFENISVPDDDILISKKSALEYLASSVSDDVAADKTDKNIIYTLKSYFSEKTPEALEIMDYAKDRIKRAKVLSDASIKCIMSDELTASISQLERYAQCPFSYFITYVLSAKERKVYEIAAPDVGDSVHRALDYFVNRVREDKVGFSDMTEEYISEKIGEISKRVIGEMFSSRSDITGADEYFSKRLEKTLENCVRAIVGHISAGSFVPVGSEVWFSNDPRSDIGCVTIDIPGGKKLKIHGIIDRLDKFEKDGVTYWRVIDYKTGNKYFNLEKIAAGLDLQLAVYMDAATKNYTDGKFGAMMYFRISDELNRFTSMPTEDKAKKELANILKLDGLCLDNKDVLYAMDNSVYENKTSSVMKVTIKNDDSPYANSQTASEALVCAIAKCVRDNAAGIGKNIFDGKIPIEPTAFGENSPCQYCRFKPICLNVGIGKDERVIEKEKDKDKIKEVIIEKYSKDGRE